MHQLHFGYSEAIINPTTGITLEGFQHRFKQGIGNSGILDNLYARALSLKLNDKELIIITLDLCMLGQGTSDCFREAISGKFEIPKEQIMISVSHTHSAPATSIYKDEGIDEDKYLKMEKEKQNYLETVKEHILTICSEARFHNHSAILTSTTLKMHLGYTRRYSYINDQGSPAVKMHYNLWSHPGEEINRDIDPDIPVIMLERLQSDNEDDYLEPHGEKRIVIFSVPYHPVVLGMNNRLVSADYPGAARKCIEEVLGSGTKAMFLLGACGDINVMMACQQNPNAVQIVGRAIGYSVVAALSNRNKIEVETIEAIENHIPEENENKRTVIQVFKIGKAAIAAVSGECFSELGIRVRETPNFDQILISTNSNGGVGYLPSKTAFAEGGYEVAIARKMGHSEETLNNIIQKIIKIIKY